jgi:hypothetical protein
MSAYPCHISLPHMGFSPATKVSPQPLCEEVGTTENTADSRAHAETEELQLELLNQCARDFVPNTTMPLLNLIPVASCTSELHVT